MVKEFFVVFREYRKAHPFMYSVRIAYGIAFIGLPF